MRQLAKRTKTYEETILVKQCCDLCGAEAKHGEWPGKDDFTQNVNETEVSVTVKHKQGSSWPEGGSGTEVVVDVCPKCFRERLLVWLRSQGAVIEEKEWDW